MKLVLAVVTVSVALGAAGQSQPTGGTAGKTPKPPTIQTPSSPSAISQPTNRPTFPLVIMTSRLASGKVGKAYTEWVMASGGRIPYSWHGSGKWPEGLSLSGIGAISGTPLASGTFILAVHVTDSHGAVATRFLKLTIAP